ncbi:hypothetical protein TruAng_005493 [Truncatella angustata]|nr:hypothetical protein TruAng_005493 [Truncatella angustata]
MCLRWPPDLPWSSNSPSNQIARSPIASNAIQIQNNVGAYAAKPESQPASLIPTVYKQTLNSSEIRLMCLDCGEAEAPIHVTLEVHEQDSCPEYETVSYTWAGEDGKSDEHKVIYAGEFWDVLPQTINCWYLLQYLRPAKGARVVWVDAICINQNDVVERGVQVAKMGEIYSLCSRVVIWLGRDVVTKSTKSNRSRRRFEDILEYGSLEDIFSRRYFTRVWIMQELLLAPYTVIPFRDKDFHAGPSTVKHLVNLVGQERWNEVGRPWLLHLNASSHLPKRDLYDSLRKMLSPDVGATDRRDIIFGILGLIRSSKPLVPDYSLSFRDTVIGVSAYLLLALKRLEILFHAGAQKTISTYPSWIPNWDTAWFQMPDTLDENPHPKSPNDILEGFMGNFSLGPGTTGGPNQIAPRWNLDISIDVSSASLTLKLAHLMKVPSRPLRYDSDGVENNSCFIFSSPSCELVLLCDAIPLDEIVEPEKDHIFLIEHDRKARYMLLLMRQLELPGHYRLIVSWSCYDLSLITKQPPQDLSDHFIGSSLRAMPSFHTYVYPWKSLADAIRDVESSHKFSPHYTHDTNRASDNCAECDPALLIFEQLFPGTTWPLDFVLQVFQNILDEIRHIHNIRIGRIPDVGGYDECHEPLSQTFIKGVRQAFSFFGYEVDEHCISATITLRQWKDGPHGHGLWEPFDADESMLRLHANPQELPESQLLIRLHLPLQVLFNQISLRSRFFNAFKNLRFYMSVTTENEMGIALNKNNSDYTGIFPRCWPQVALDELGLDEAVQQVVIE